MTIWTVKAGAGKGDGSQGAPFGTLAAAMAAARPGDEVVVGAGVYRERLACKTDRVTWRSEEPLAAILDGGWDGKSESDSEYAGQIAIAVDGVVVEGFTVRNAPGRGITIGGDDVVVRGCLVDTCYSGGLSANRAARPLIENNVIRNIGLSWTAGMREHVSGSLILVLVEDGVVRGNHVHGGHGEGINCGKGTTKTVVEGNLVNDCGHLGYYLNRCVGCIVRNNVAVLTLDDKMRAKDEEVWPAAYVFGDEVGADNKTSAFPYQSGNQLVGNVAVGYGTLIDVRNNLPKLGKPLTGYNTQLADTLIEGNTLVGGPGTRRGFNLQNNQRGRPHRGVVVRNNVIEMSNAQADANIGGEHGGDGVTYEHNAWSTQPPAGMRSATDVVGDLGLANPRAAVTGSGAAGLTRFDIDNYRPAPGSRLIEAGMATLGALLPLTSEPPVEPPPVEPPEVEGVDWAALEARVAAVDEQLAVAELAIGVASDELTALRRLVNEYRAGDAAQGEG